MCVEDYQIVQRAVIKTYTRNPTGFGAVRLTIEAPVLWVRAVDSGGNPMPIRTDSLNEFRYILPYDNAYIQPGLSYGYVTRRQVGAAIDGPLWVDESVGVPFAVQWMTADGEVYKAITERLGG